MKIVKVNIIVILFVIIPGCLKDDPLQIPNVEVSNTIGILSYLERTTGDFANSSANPALIESLELKNNIANYLILDVRSEEKFNLGHIRSSVNIQSDSLLLYIKSTTINNYPKVVIVSETGQSAAYYAMLLRLAGYSNVYSLNFGLSYWHKDFSDKWIKSIGNFNQINTFIQEEFQKYKFTNLPSLTFANENQSIEIKLEERIQLLLSEGFPEELVEVNSKFESASLITIEKIYENDLYSENTQDAYIICLGGKELYLAGKMSEPFPEKGHPAGTINYIPPFELRSINFLQTIPTDKRILIYDYNGQLSASITAYLRVLGYNAKSILYGANHLFYSRLLMRGSEFAFYPDAIPNFEYEK